MSAPGALLELLGRWLPTRRWFPGAAATPHVTLQASATLTDPAGEAAVMLLLIAAQLPNRTVTVQLPVTFRDAAAPALSQLPTSAVIGTLPPGGLEPVLRTAQLPADLHGVLTSNAVSVCDGPYDPAYVRAWLAQASAPAPAASASAPRALLTPPAPLAVTVHRTSPDVDLSQVGTTPHVLGGEQSNTSAVLAGPRPAMFKTFRVVSPGENPDVTVPLALATAGFTGVPGVLAWSTGELGASQRAAIPHEVPTPWFLAVLTDLIPDAHDGFEMLRQYAADGKSAETHAADLGAVTAQMHAVLAQALPHEAVPVPDLAATLAHAVDETLAQVPELAAQADALAAAIPELTQGAHHGQAQRIHGDYHLGQVLWSPQRGWTVLDFEGEPLRPLAQRTAPDDPLRDVAGMLRSFDYAAALGGGNEQWLTAAREAFLSGYTEARAGSTDGQLPPIDPAALRAHELIKALYEARYEAASRPRWLWVPMRAIQRLVTP